jgi:hypothetical protein
MPTTTLRRSGPVHPEPDLKPQYPWRFSIGQFIHALHHTTTLQVTGGELWMGCPHLHAVDIHGKTWRIPQLHASSTPINFRKG